MAKEYERTSTEVVTIDWRGNPVKLDGVPALKDRESGRLWVEPQEVVRAELNQLAKSVGIHPREIPILLLLYAQPGPFQRGYAHTKYKLNKMLFYQWKELESAGLDGAYERDEFVPGRRGPIPKHLGDDLQDLQKKRLVDLEGGKENRKSLEATLTGDGTAVARLLWNALPPVWNETSTKVKTWLFPLAPRTIMERVHRDFPEFRETYVEPDEE